jgi:multidrug efflux pump subunit AcrA (membrane-fusion protein)
MRTGIFAAAAAILLVVALFFGLRSKAPAPAIAHATSDSKSQVLRLKGTTEAVESRAILAPLLAGQSVPTLTIIRLTPAGSRVKRGDVLVEFDRQAQMRDFIDKKAEYEKLVAQVEEEQAKESSARPKD